MRSLVEHLAKSLVDHPDAVVVTEVDGPSGTVLELKVAQSDLGKVIGRRGRTVRAMRTVVAAAGAKTGRRFGLELLE